MSAPSPYYIWNQPTSAGIPQKTTVNGLSNWWTAPTSWFFKPFAGGSNQVWASPNPDFSNPCYLCVLDDSMQKLAFQDLLAERAGSYPNIIPQISPLPFVMTNGLPVLQFADSGKVRWPFLQQSTQQLWFLSVVNKATLIELGSFSGYPSIVSAQLTDTVTGYVWTITIANGQLNYV